MLYATHRICKCPSGHIVIGGFFGLWWQSCLESVLNVWVAHFDCNEAEVTHVMQTECRFQIQACLNVSDWMVVDSDIQFDEFETRARNGLSSELLTA